MQHTADRRSQSHNRLPARPGTLRLPARPPPLPPGQPQRLVPKAQPCCGLLSGPLGVPSPQPWDFLPQRPPGSLPAPSRDPPPSSAPCGPPPHRAPLRSTPALLCLPNIPGPEGPGSTLLGTWPAAGEGQQCLTGFRWATERLVLGAQVGLTRPGHKRAPHAQARASQGRSGHCPSQPRGTHAAQ